MTKKFSAKHVKIEAFLVVWREVRSSRTSVGRFPDTWVRNWQSLLQSEKYCVGKANPELFFHSQRDMQGAVHGDDFYGLATKSAIDHIGIVLASKKKAHERHRLGFGKHCFKTAVALNRITVVGECTYVRFETHARHLELISKQHEFAISLSAAVTLGVRHTNAGLDRRKGETPLSYDIDHCVQVMRCASKLSLISPCGLGRVCEEFCSTIVKTIDAFDVRSQTLGTILAGQAFNGFEIRATTHARNHPCINPTRQGCDCWLDQQDKNGVRCAEFKQPSRLPSMLRESNAEKTVVQLNTER